MLKDIGRRILIMSCICLLFTNWLVPQPASACSKGYETSLEEDYAIAANIFTGKVTEFTEIYSGGLMKIAKIQPDESYKGEALTFVLTRTDSDQCGADLTVGESYLFYAWGLEQNYVNVFTRFHIKDAGERLEWLEKRAALQPPKHPAGERVIEVYDRGGVSIQFGKRNLGILSSAFIMDNMTYVPLSFVTDVLGYEGSWDAGSKRIEFARKESSAFPNVTLPDVNGTYKGINVPRTLSVWYDDIQISMDGNVQSGLPEAFLVRDQPYVPLRAVTERLGLRVGWFDGWNTVFINPPIDASGQTWKLEMQYTINVGMGGKIIVDRLTADEIYYRYYHGHLPEGSEPELEKHPYTHMLKEELEYPVYVPEFYLTDDVQEVKLLMTPELAGRIAVDGDFRNQIGSRLGKVAAKFPEDRVITEAFFE